MEVETIRRKVYTETFNPHYARDFVYQHRNVFDKSTRRYIFMSYPSVIKEISTSPSGKKTVWYWIFLLDRYKIVKGSKNEDEILKKKVFEITRKFNEKKVSKLRR